MLLVTFSPELGQYQSAFGVFVGYTGLTLAASPWLTVR